jgi:hypothetical protein
MVGATAVLQMCYLLHRYEFVIIAISNLQKATIDTPPRTRNACRARWLANIPPIRIFLFAVVFVKCKASLKAHLVCCFLADPGAVGLAARVILGCITDGMVSEFMAVIPYSFSEVDYRTQINQLPVKCP